MEDSERGRSVLLDSGSAFGSVLCVQAKRVLIWLAGCTQHDSHRRRCVFVFSVVLLPTHISYVTHPPLLHPRPHHPSGIRVGEAIGAPGRASSSVAAAVAGGGIGGQVPSMAPVQATMNMPIAASAPPSAPPSEMDEDVPQEYLCPLTLEVRARVFVVGQIFAKERERKAGKPERLGRIHTVHPAIFDFCDTPSCFAPLN